jgi:hypothetical protein
MALLPARARTPMSSPIFAVVAPSRHRPHECPAPAVTVVSRGVKMGCACPVQRDGHLLAVTTSAGDL